MKNIAKLPYVVMKNKILKPVKVNKEELKKNGIRVLTASNLIEVSDTHLVRHNTKVLSKMIYELALDLTSTIQFNRIVNVNSIGNRNVYDMITYVCLIIKIHNLYVDHT